MCEVTVNSASNKQETINVTLKDTRANITLAKVTINVNPQDDTRKIAELLYNELKSKASRLYDIKLEKESSKIILKQRLAMNAGTAVILNEEITDDVNTKVVEEKQENVQSKPQNHEDVQPEPLKEDQEKNHIEEKKEESIVNPIVKHQEKLPEKIETVKKDNQGKKEEPIAEKQNEKIKDNINHELVKEEKENEVIKNVEDIQPSTQESKDVQPEPLKEEQEKNHSEEEKVNPIVKNEEKLPEKIEIVERHNEVKKEESIAEKNVEIQSNLVQHYVRRERAQAQIGDLAFKFKGKGQNKLQNPQTIKILDKTIQLDAGDDSSKIKTKILKAFEGNQDWIFGVGYVVIEENGASVQYKCKEIMENVDKLAEDTSEIKFIQEDEDMGTLGVAEKKEVCEVTVNSTSNKQETINVTLKDTKANITLATATINVNPQDDTRKIAELLYNELKSKASRLYDIKLEKESSKIILKQRLAMNAGTTVSIER
ncbi:hypothetical protein AXF41_00020 [Clostridium haemolyticum]|nr:hypothetical protein AXF41_00020 [Clostridium haemolyticum]